MYYKVLKFFQKQIEDYAKQIFKVYGNELTLKLEDYNLLEDENNSIESSRSIGFIIEEFLISKLSIYTRSHKNDDVVILRKRDKATRLSYDSYAIFQNIFFMLNIKVQKMNSNNNAIAAINLLYNDYVLINPDQTKAYLILKIHYRLGVSKNDYQRKIIIQNIYSFF